MAGSYFLEPFATEYRAEYNIINSRMLSGNNTIMLRKCMKPDTFL